MMSRKLLKFCQFGVLVKQTFKSIAVNYISLFSYLSITSVQLHHSLFMVNRVYLNGSRKLKCCWELKNLLPAIVIFVVFVAVATAHSCVLFPG